ncbi:MAG: helix-turn-helix domain-containing protein [Anaerolineaceae bacterium]|nr:helix-turn-helix domain-containing protein [Anaerolineaceae bacterium]
MNHLEPILTVSETAAYLKLSKSKVYLMVQKNQIPHLKMGKSVRIRERDLLAWIEEQIVQNDDSLYS